MACDRKKQTYSKDKMKFSPSSDDYSLVNFNALGQDVSQTTSDPLVLTDIVAGNTSLSSNINLLDLVFKPSCFSYIFLSTHSENDKVGRFPESHSKSFSPI